MNLYEKYFNNRLVSLLFSIVGSLILVISAIDTINIIAILTIPILVCSYYILYGRVLEEKKKGIVIYLIAFSIIFALGLFFIVFGITISNIDFYEWIMINGADENKVILYSIAVVILLPFIFSSLTYYYSVNIPRIPMMFLIVFIPRTLYSKSSYLNLRYLNYVLVIALLLLFFERNISKIKGKVKEGMISLTSAFVVIVLIFSIATAIPIPNVMPEIPVFQQVKEGIYGAISYKGEYSNFVKDMSSKDINESYKNNSNKLLYSFVGDNPEYFIERFYVDYKDNKWNKHKDPSNEFINTHYSIEESRRVIDTIKNSSYRSKFYDYIYNNNQAIDEKLLEIKSEGIYSKTLPHPVNLLDYYNYSGNEIIHSDYDEIRNKNNKYFSTDDVHTMNFISENIKKNSNEEFLITNMTEERYLEFVEDYYGKKEEEIINVAYRRQIYAKLNDNITNKSYKLANSLIEGSTTVYEKARNIENYLRSSEFEYTYDLPKSTNKGDYIEYFLFEGKKGYCVQFATAMTILCRAANLEARYCEGYLITEDNFVDGKYLITEKDAHAFVQVYLPGYGWKVFDPTPSSMGATKEEFNYEKLKENNKNIEEARENNYGFILIAILIILTLITIVYFIIKLYLKKTKRPRYLKKINKMKKEEAFEELLKNSVELLKNCALSPFAGETLMNFSKRVDKNLSMGFEDLVRIYYEFKYNNKIISNQELELAYKINNEIYNFTIEK